MHATPRLSIGLAAALAHTLEERNVTKAEGTSRQFAEPSAVLFPARNGRD